MRMKDKVDIVTDAALIGDEVVRVRSGDNSIVIENRTRD